MLTNFHNHIANVLDIGVGDVVKYINKSKVLKDYSKVLDLLHSDSVGVEEESSSMSSSSSAVPKEDIVISKSSNKNTGRGNWLLNGEKARQEIVFSEWFRKVDDWDNYDFCRRFLDGESRGRTNLKGYLQKAGIVDINTFIRLFNIFIDDLKYTG